MAKKRKEFKDKYKWNVKDLYKSDEEALKEIEYLNKKIDELKQYEGHILDSHTNLLNLLDLDSDLSLHIERVYTYAHINNDADTLDEYYQELFGKVQNMYTKYLKTSAFIVPELLEKDYKLIEKYCKEEEKLNKYKRVLKEIYRDKEHILSNEEEQIIANYSKLMGSFEEIMGALTDSDFKFDNIIVDGQEEELTESNYAIYLHNPNPSVRRDAFKSLYKTYANFKTTLAAVLRNEVEKNVVNAKLRKYQSSLEASLFHDEISKEVYTNLIRSVHNNLKSLYKYWELKKQVLKLDELHIYDIYASVTNNSNKKYSFEEARDLVLKIVSPLGEDYVKDITKAFDDNWIDSCNNEGKRKGAYCTACYDVHPYVLLNYEQEIEDISTLSHELGHAMHYFYACQNQSFQDYGYSIFVAEVASQVNEILLSRYLLDHSDDKNEKIKIIDDLLQKYKATIYRQTMFAEFELYIHEYTEAGGILTSQNMCQKYLELNRLYFGDNVIIDDEIKYEWERIPHFYMNFYVYQYATGFAAAILLANKIYEKDLVTRDKYLEFLKLGATKKPIESLKVAGVDMLDSKVMDEVIKFMDELIKEYQELIGSEENE